MLRGLNLTTKLLQWKDPNHHILETLTCIEKLSGYVFTMKTGFQAYHKTIFGKSRDQNRKIGLKLERRTLMDIANGIDD